MTSLFSLTRMMGNARVTIPKCYSLILSQPWLDTNGKLTFNMTRKVSSKRERNGFFHHFSCYLFCKSCIVTKTYTSNVKHVPIRQTIPCLRVQEPLGLTLRGMGTKPSCFLISCKVPYASLSWERSPG